MNPNFEVTVADVVLAAMAGTLTASTAQRKPVQLKVAITVLLRKPLHEWRITPILISQHHFERSLLLPSYRNSKHKFSRF